MLGAINCKQFILQAGGISPDCYPDYGGQCLSAVMNDDSVSNRDRSIMDAVIWNGGQAERGFVSVALQSAPNPSEIALDDYLTVERVKIESRAN